VLDKKLSNLIMGSSSSSSSKEDPFTACSVSVVDKTSSADYSLCMSPSSVITTSTTRAFQDAPLSVDHCRHRRRSNRRRSTRRSSSFNNLPTDLDRSEVLSTSIVCAMDEEKSEQHCLLRRQRSLETQIEALKSIASAAQ
jgi:hypothetical protein